MDELQSDSGEDAGIAIPVNTQPENSKSGKVKNGLKAAAAIVAFVCAAVSLATIVALYFGVLGDNGNSDGYTAEQSATVVLMALLGIFFAISMVIICFSCIGAGLLYITNRSENKAKYIWGAVLGIFDVLAIVFIAVVGSMAQTIGVNWFYALVAPFAVDLIMRVGCTIYCLIKKEKHNG